MPAGAVLASRTQAQRNPSSQDQSFGGSEITRFYDPATEAIIYRLTAQNGNSVLPHPWQHSMSVRAKFLVFASDRNGKFAPFLLDLKTGISRQLAEATAMLPRSLWLDGTDRAAYFQDGDQLKEISLSNRRTVTVADGLSGFALGPGRGQVLLRSGSTIKTATGQVLASDVSGSFAVAPSGKSLWYLQTGDKDEAILFAVPLGGGMTGRTRFVPLSSGRVSFPFWAQDSQSVLFLRQVEGNDAWLSEIHSASTASPSSEQVIAPTSQFASFAPNANGTVYVGASGSKAQPDIILLLRATHRELTVCEHHATVLSPVLPRFSPDSHRVIYESDREGKSALYSIDVEQLVEST